MEIGPGTGVKHLIPKKFLSLTVSPLRPHPDSRIDCAMVTLAGTRNSRWLCWAGMTAAAMKSALVMVPFGPPATVPSTTGPVYGPTDATVTCGTTGAGQVGSELLDRTYACETYPPLAVRSHWLLVRTLPLTFSPATLQTSVTRARLASRPTVADRVVAAARRLRGPATVVVTVAASAAVTLPPTIAAVADRASSGPSIHRRVVRDIRLPPRYTTVTYDLPGTGLPGRSARGAAGVQGRVALAKPVYGPLERQAPPGQDTGVSAVGVAHPQRPTAVAGHRGQVDLIADIQAGTLVPVGIAE